MTDKSGPTTGRDYSGGFFVVAFLTFCGCFVVGYIMREVTWGGPVVILGLLLLLFAGIALVALPPKTRHPTERTSSSWFPDWSFIEQTDEWRNQ